MIRTIFLLFGLFIGCHFLQSQELIDSALQKFSDQYPQEKLHLMLNKKAYVAGEDLYFKAIVIHGFRPSDISSSLFVELYDKNKKIIAKKIFPIFKGESTGDILLPDNLEENTYYLRAYTTWMGNFSEKFNLIQELPIYNPKSKQKLVKNDGDWHVTIHPESGNLIANNENVVAVRMFSDGKLPEKWSGILHEKSNPKEKLLEFSQLDQNVGAFTFTPKLNQLYELVITDEKGMKKNFDLPMVKSKGFSLYVNNQEDFIYCTLKFNELPDDFTSCTLIGQIDAVMVYKAKIKKINGETTLKIPTEAFVNGILQLVLLNDKNEILAERLCFVKPNSLDMEKPDMAIHKINQKPKTLNSLEISTNNPFVNLTASISDAEFPNTEDEKSLLSTMWLTGEISTEIEKPAQYFTKNRNIKALDALLISEKYERFSWNKILKGDYPKIIHTPLNYITYVGKASLSGVAVKNKTINLIFENGNFGNQILQVDTDDKGYFVVDNLIFTKPFKILYQLNNVKLKDGEFLSVSFQPKVEPIPLYSSLPNSKYTLVSKTEQTSDVDLVYRTLSEMEYNKIYTEKVAEIEEVVINANKTERRDKLNKELSSSLFRGINETVFDFVNEEQFVGNNIMTWLAGRVPGLEIRQQNGNMIPEIRGVVAPVFVNELPMDVGFLNNISPSEIAMIKVIKAPFQATQNGGVIAIYLKNGNTKYANSKNKVDENPHLDFKTMKGYDIAKEYKNIDGKNNIIDTKLQDNRINLFWNPNLVIEKSESKLINFQNNENAKAYQTVIFGYDSEAQKFIYFYDNL